MPDKLPESLIRPVRFLNAAETAKNETPETGRVRALKERALPLRFKAAFFEGKNFAIAGGQSVTSA